MAGQQRRDRPFGQATKLIVCVMLICSLSGCQIIGAGLIAVAGVVGFAGYAVYKTGEAVVTGVGKAGSAVATGTTAAVSVIFFNGDFKTRYQGDVQTVWSASRRAFERALLSGIEGSYDALSGELTARTREGTGVRVRLTTLDAQSTEACIRVGVTGDMRMSETIYNLILQELPVRSTPQGITSSGQKVRP